MFPKPATFNGYVIALRGKARIQEQRELIAQLQQSKLSAQSAKAELIGGQRKD
jgi:hypothetical protein